jgi:hypothetical protein
MERSEEDMSLENPVMSPGIDPGTVRLVAQPLNHYATPGPNITTNSTNNYCYFYYYCFNNVGQQIIATVISGCLLS